MSLFAYEEESSKPSVDLKEVKEALKKVSIFACDLETTGLSLEEDRITIVAFAAEVDGEIKGWAVETSDYPIETIRKEFQDIFQDESKICVYHNANFDIKFLNKYGIYVYNRLADTMIMAWLNDEDRIRHSLGKDGKGGGKRGYGLKWCVLKHLGYRMSSYDEARSLFGAFEEYAADDAVQTLKLFFDFREKLRKLKLMDWFWQVEMPIVQTLIEAETRGVMLDKQQLKKIKKEAWIKVEELEKKIYNKVGYVFDIGSPKQWAHILFSEMRIGMTSPIGVPPEEETNELSTKGKSGQWSTSNAVLTAMAQKGHEIAKLALKFREINTRLNVFIRPLLERCRTCNIIHPRFIQIGTVTGRFASRDPNYQNLPRKGGVRKSFIARPGFKIVKADYCVTGDTRIETDRGTLKIIDVLPGDNVVIEDGSTAKVTEVIDRGILPIVELTTIHGYKIKANKLHRIRVIDKKGDYIWRHIGKLKVSDRVAIQPGCGKGSIQKLPRIEFTHFNNKIFEVPKEVTEAAGQFFGYLCGDGCSDLHVYDPIKKNKGSSYIGSIHDKQDKDFIDWAKEEYKKLFRGSHLQEYIYKDKEAVELKITSKPLLLWTRKVGISKQHVPEVIKKSPRNVVAAFLRGYFETDGSIGNKSNGQRISASSSRKSLIEEIQLLLLKVGIPSCIRKNITTLPNGKKYDSWKVNIPTSYANLFAKEIGFISKRKKDQLSEYLKTCNRCPSIGGYPHQKDKVKNLVLSGEIRRLLNNTSAMGRKISRKLAAQVKNEDEKVYKELQLFRIAEYNTLFEKVKSIEEIVEEQVYDLSVPGPTTYISNGFVSHNCQAELRLMSHMSGDPAMIAIYLKNGDIHQATADACGVSRQAAKAINFGLIYRMSAYRLQAQLAIQGIEFPIEDCYRFVNRYFRKYVMVKRYHKRVEQTVMDRLDKNGQYGWIKTLGGRFRRLDSHMLTSSEFGYPTVTKAINCTIQGGVSDLIKIAMVETQNTFRKNGWLNPEKGIWDACIQGQVHDEIFVECKEELAEEVAKIISYHMENAGRKYKIRVPMTAEAEIVDNLAK